MKLSPLYEAKNPETVFLTYYENRQLVSNDNILHGIENQVQEYLKNEFEKRKKEQSNQAVNFRPTYNGKPKIYDIRIYDVKEKDPGSYSAYSYIYKYQLIFEMPELIIK